MQASISLYKLQKSSKSSQVNVHHVSGSWNSRTLQWSNRPDYDSRVQDYLMVQDTGWYTWDITDIAQKWYQTGNNGMLFKMPDSVLRQGLCLFRRGAVRAERQCQPL